ncbi:MAG: DUF2905 family protein [Acidobacteria bacterium]|nr:DUF2905 family protein [Acidobacteriota bacterium]
MLSEIGKTLIFFGAALLILGLLLTLLPSLRIGRFPGDVFIRKGSWNIYVPVTTGILLSLLLTLLFWIVSTIKK